MTPSRLLRTALAAIALAAGAAAIAFTWQPGLATFHDDSASYLVMAQAFSPWSAASPAVQAQMPYERYPPLFPATLALLGAAGNWHWAHALVALSFAASVALLGIHAARAAESVACGIAAALVYALLPGVWLNLKGILSEFPYMALSFGVLAWFARRPAGAALPAFDVGILAALLAAAMLTRTIGFTLAVAIALAEAGSWTRTRDTARLRSVAIALALAAALAAAWYVARPSAGYDAYVASSVGVLDRARAEGASWIVTLSMGNLDALFGAWMNALVIYWGEPWQPKFVAGAALAATMLAAVAWRAYRLEVDGLYAALFLAVLVVWPFPGQMYRLALPVFPLALALAFLAVRHVARSRLARFTADRAVAYAALLPLAFCVPALFYIAERARFAAVGASTTKVGEIMEYYRIPFRPDAQAAAEQQLRGFDDMARIHATTTPGSSVMSYGPAYIALLASRRAVPLDYPESEAGMAAQVARARPDFVYLSRIHPRDSAHRLGDPLAPARFLASRAETVWWRAAPDGKPEAALLRVRPQQTEGSR